MVFMPAGAVARRCCARHACLASACRAWAVACVLTRPGVTGAWDSGMGLGYAQSQQRGERCVDGNRTLAAGHPPDRSLPGLGRTRIRPARAAAVFGVLVGLGLAALLVFWLVSDWHLRLQAAQRQATATAAGAALLLDQDLGHVESTLRGVAADTVQVMAGSGGSLQAQGAVYAAGLAGRNPQIEQILLLDAAGAALLPDGQAGTVPAWTWPAADVAGTGMLVGTLQPGPRGTLALPVALPVREAGQQDWLVAWIGGQHLQSMLDSLDVGAGGVTSLERRDDHQLLARNVPPYTDLGKRFSVPEPSGQAPEVRTSPIDGTRRLVVVEHLRHYPLNLWVALSLREIMAPWYRALAVAVSVVVLYLLALSVLLAGLLRGEREQAHLLARLNRNVEALRAAQRAGKVATWAVRADGRALAWESDVGELFGVQMPGGVPMRALARHIAPADRLRVLRRFLEAWRASGVFSVEFRLRGSDDATRWVAARGGVVDGADGRRRMTGTLVDISERVQAQSRVSDAERQFRQVFDRNPMPYWVVAPDSLALLDFNQAAVALYGFSRAELAGMSLPDLHAGEDRAALRALLARPEQPGGEGGWVWKQRRRDGSVLQVRMHVGQLAYGGRDACLVLAEDVTERLEQERELAYRARYDQTTGLLNLQVLAEALDSGQYPGYQVIYLQLTALQALRDALGREPAEVVLRTLAERLQHWADRYGLAAHQPADDFVLAVLDSQHTEEALAAAVAAVREPLGDGSMQSLGACLGVAEDEAGSLRAEQVVDNAALAAHALHDSGGLAVSRFDGALARSYGERLRLASRLRTAVEQEEFELVFQPIVRASDARTVALEALLRWPQRSGDQVPPSRFIPLCEDTGLILPLGGWVLQRAAQAQAGLRRSGLDVPVAVNVSALQMLHGDLPAVVAAACREGGIAPAGLHLELTESVLMQRPEQALATMAELRRMGVGLSLDDFGTGFSSMTYLRHMPLSSVKIDRAFVSGVDTDPRNAAICLAMLQLARSLGLSCIGEGVETQAELAWLRANGCEQVQGFLLGRPQSLRELGIA